MSWKMNESDQMIHLFDTSNAGPSGPPAWSTYSIEDHLELGVNHLRKDTLELKDEFSEPSVNTKTASAAGTENINSESSRESETAVHLVSGNGLEGGKEIPV